MHENRKRGRPPHHPRVINVTLGTVHDTFEDAARELRKRGRKGYRSKVWSCCEGGQQTHCNCRFCYEKKKKS